MLEKYTLQEIDSILFDLIEMCRNKQDNKTIKSFTLDILKYRKKIFRELKLTRITDETRTNL